MKGMPPTLNFVAPRVTKVVYVFQTHYLWFIQLSIERPFARSSLLSLMRNLPYDTYAVMHARYGRACVRVCVSRTV